MNRLEWILGIFLVILLLVVLAMALMLWTQPDSPTEGLPPEVAERNQLIAPTPAFAGQTAKTAYALALATAQTWQPDVALLTAEATWPQGAGVQDLTAGESSWTFTFYSANQQAIRVTAVVEENVTLLAERSYQLPYTLPALDLWQIDSNRAIQLFLAEGGSTFIQNEQITTLIVSLQTDEPIGQFTWSISSFAPQTFHSLTINIDANSGEIINIDR